MDGRPEIPPPERSTSTRVRRRPGRERILRAMDLVFYRDGVTAAVVDDLIAEAGVARGTLYKNFRTRDALLDAYFQHRHEATMEVFTEIAARHVSLEQMIDAIFDYLGTLCADDSFRGCAFVVGAAEMPDAHRPAMVWAKRHKRAASEVFQQMFDQHDVVDSKARADELSLLYDGAIVTSVLRPDSQAIETSRSMAHRLISAGL